TPSGGPPLTLGVDLSAAGTFEPVTHAPSRVAQVDGYTGELVPGATSPVTLTVSRAGHPVTDLQPYVHPGAATSVGPQIKFGTEVPSPGMYRLFVDFRHGDVVRTAEFTVATGGAGEETHR
ncbi:MAG: hypothetical protein L0H84_13985, partial [Pseudonocardia sp.]|nr:hypothetical protein [Pseudonocardia sp.]